MTIKVYVTFAARELPRDLNNFFFLYPKIKIASILKNVLFHFGQKYALMTIFSETHNFTLTFNLKVNFK